VETDLLRAAILTRGGGLAKVELKAFANGHEPGPVDLVLAGNQALDVGLSWGEQLGRQLSLRSAQFKVRREQRPDLGERGQRVVLTARRSDGLTCTREYVFRDGSYEVEHAVEVVGIPGALAPPDLVVGWRTGIPYTEGNKQANENYCAAIVRVGDEVKSWNPGKFKNGPRMSQGTVRWAAVSNKYFLAAIVPEAGTATAVGADGDPTSHRNSAWLHFPASSSRAARAGMKLYLGPKEIDRLKEVDPGLGDAVSLGYRWIRPLAQFMLGIMKATYRFVPNYGLVIIILSVAVRVLLFPLNQKSMRSMKSMQRLNPEMEALKKKYKDKPQELNKETMLLYKKHKVNPLGGCLPMVVQMPVLFALYFAFMFAIDLRMAPFTLWIQDLSAPDTVAKVGGFSIHVLPLLMTGVSVLQARTTPTDPRQATMTTIMPIMFLVFFYSMPAGLVLYWTMSSLATWIQQAWVNRGEPRKGDAAAAGASGEQPGGLLGGLLPKPPGSGAAPERADEPVDGDGDGAGEAPAEENAGSTEHDGDRKSGPDRNGGRRDGAGARPRGKRSEVGAGATTARSKGRRRRRR
jgi:YidC/Oxa1 family membrane protein insertase